jgi:hypothetical protein
MSNFMEDVGDRLKKIPPWGYAAIAGGVLLLAFLTKSKGAPSDTTPIIQSVDPSVATYNNDAEWRMQDMYNRLEGQMNEKNDTIQSGIDDLKSQIEDLKKAPAAPAAPSTPARLQFRGGFDYRLKPGENLETVANKNYKSGYTGLNKQAILQANEGKEITAGHVIYVPYL